jgi:alpha-glucosidase
MNKLSERLEFFRRMAGQGLVDDILQTEENLRQARERFEKNKLSDETLKWRIVGAVESMTEGQDGILLQCEQGWVQMRWLAPDCVHIRYGSVPADFETYFSYAVNKSDWPSVGRDVVHHSDAIVVRTSDYIYRIKKFPLHLTVETYQGQTVCADALGVQRREDGAVRLSMHLQADEACYGLGERAESLNLRGGHYRLWNTDPPRPYMRGDDPLYYNIPFYVGVHNNAVYGVLWDNSNRSLADLGKQDASELVFESEAGAVSYYLFAGADLNGVLARYTELTGRIPLPPLWFLGYQQCRWSYYPDEAVLDLAHEFRTRRIPCDVLYLDIHYMDDYRIFTWNNKLFTNPSQMIRMLHDQGFRVVAIVDPGVKIDPEYAVYRSGLREDVFLRYPDGELVAAAVWPGLCHFPDFTRSDVRAWWARHCLEFLSCGLDGLWNDMCEPATFALHAADTLPDCVRHGREGQGGDHLENHNVYGMQMARATLEALKTYRPDARPVNMLRAGYAGTQRYASSWTGDNSATWDHLRLSISMTLNMGLSGAPMTGPDIGGFFESPDGELLTRWLQAACFLPYYRVHAALGTAQQEPWVFGEPYESINRQTIALRYRLLPYIYSVVAQAAEYGWPVVRPLFTLEMDNPSLRSVDDSYLLGDALLVAPILERGAVERSVYLPRSADWYDFWTNERYDGGQVIQVSAPLHRLPLYVRAGTTLPLWPEMQYVGEQALEQLTLRYYPGSHETVLYEDAGEGTGYLQGQYRWVYITAKVEGERLLLSRRTAGSFEPAYTAVTLEVVGLNDEPDAIRLDRRGAPVWFYDDDILEIKADHFSSLEIILKPTSSDPTLLTRPW